MVTTKRRAVSQTLKETAHLHISHILPIFRSLFSSGAASLNLIIPKNLSRCPDNSRFSPLFTASCQNAWTDPFMFSFLLLSSENLIKNKKLNLIKTAEVLKGL